MVYCAEVDVGSESRRGKSWISQVHIIKYINLSGQEEVSSPSIQAPIPLRLTNMVENFLERAIYQADKARLHRTLLSIITKDDAAQKAAEDELLTPPGSPPERCIYKFVAGSAYLEAILPLKIWLSFSDGHCRMRAP